MNTIVKYLRKFTGPLAADQLSDGELLEHFVRRHDESAFEVLMQRHGPLVLNVCRRLLRDPNDVDDAFQAVFLVLVRRAGTLERRPYLGGWLYEVAYRTSLKARTQAAKRQQRQRTLDDQASSEDAPMEDKDMHALLHEELSRLPDKYRAPAVLCYLQGQSTEEAARQIGCPRGTILWRLSRARDLLRDRLGRRGVALTSTAVAAAFSTQAVSAAVPASLSASTARAALVLARGESLAAAAVSPGSQALYQEVQHGLSVAHLRLIGTLAVAGLLVAVTTGWLAWALFLAGPASTSPADTPVRLPDDPNAVVATLALQADREADEETLLTIRADGTATCARGPEGNRSLKLTPAELQALLRYIVRDNRFFAHDSAWLEAELRAAAGRKNQVHGFRNAEATLLRLQADGQEHEVRCTALGDSLVRQYPELTSVAQLNNVRRRLIGIVHLIEAGGPSGVNQALARANRQLRSDFPNAPELRAEDLQAVQHQPGGAIELVFERRGVGSDGDPFTFIYAKLPADDEGPVTVRARLQASGDAIASEGKLDRPLDITPPPIRDDKTIKYDYDIVYVRSPRPGDNKLTEWAEAFSPVRMEPGSDLVLLHPDGTEEVLVEAGKGAVADPYVSFDGETVFYALFHDMAGPKPNGLSQAGADIYKIHVPTRKITRLTHQERTPNTGVIAADGLKNVGVFNLGPCPLPGGKIMFTSNRNGFQPPKGYTSLTLQLFVMDEDGANVEMIGHLNIGSALHPTILRDGRVMFSSYESQGVRDLRQWGIWTIHPDGANWAPLVSAFRGEFLFHFQSQLSNGDIVVEEYYNLNNQGFGTYYTMPEQPAKGYAPFGPGYRQSPRNPELRNLHGGRMPFTPHGMKPLTPFVTAFDSPAPHADPKDNTSPRVGKFTHPSGAPENHLLTVWSPGSANTNGSHRASWYPAVDSGIYLLKSGRAIAEPGAMRLVKNDPRYNEQWPRALVPYRRIYGVEQPALPRPLANDGTLSKHLPAGTPFGLVGTSSFYKRESFPDGVVPEGQVTAKYAGGNDPYQGLDSFNGYPKRTPNWLKQGGDAGKYTNEDIHAVRILLMEPTTMRRKRFWNYASERFRILGEIPLRKFSDDKQPTDPDGNPDTSFLAKIPADVAWTFQTLDKHGMVLNMSQTWHQLRPGEIRHDCGGCHAHSQQPTPFEKTAAARPDYKIFDLTAQTPLLTSRQHDESKQKWDDDNATGLRFDKAGVHNVEYFRDIRPILRRSCAACHSKDSAKPAANLVLDDDTLIDVPNSHGGMLAGPGANVPATFARLAFDTGGKFSKSLKGGWAIPQTSRYVRMFQSRRSLLAWKLFGKRMDGWNNDDFPSATTPGDPKTLQWKGKPIEASRHNFDLADVDFTGSVMPPPAAVKSGKVKPLSADDRLMLIRWIDLGCPIDLDYDLAKPGVVPTGGWLTDEVRPTLAIASPRAGSNPPIESLLIGLHDAFTGIDMDSLEIKADFAVNGTAAGTNLASAFRSRAPGVLELKLNKPLAGPRGGKLTVAVKDRQGNVTRLERTFTIDAKKSTPTP